jgi:hypothetical protein
MTKTFDNEWIFDAFAGRPTFFTSGMFGGLAPTSERQMLMLVEPTNRTLVAGVLVYQLRASGVHQRTSRLMPHGCCGSGSTLDSAHEDF